ncbi:unnamed protein product [Heterobilharzia americana]|nr:unnamed protein product [Heterobilharzia americana]
MVPLNEHVSMIKGIVEKYVNNVSSLKTNHLNHLDELLNADHRSIESPQMNLQLAVGAAETELRKLLFEEDRLKRECEQLSKGLKQLTAQHNADLLEKKTTLEDHQSKLKFARKKLLVYERFTNTKFAIDEISITAFIVNPDDAVKVNLPNTLLKAETDLCQVTNENDPSRTEVTGLTFTEDIVAGMNRLWERMEVSDKWEHLVGPTHMQLTYQSKHQCVTESFVYARK